MGHSLKTKKEYKNLKKQEIQDIYTKINQTKPSFRYGLCRFKDIPTRTSPGKVLHDKALSIAKSSKYDGYQRGLSSMVTHFLIKICYYSHRNRN